MIHMAAVDVQNLAFNVSERGAGSRIFLDIATPYGETNSIVVPSESRMTIACFDVRREFRCQGIGKALLRKTRDEALRRDVHLIIASIISRECIDAMVSVFGPEAVHIAPMGTYDATAGGYEQGDAGAVLLYTLK